MTRACLLVLLLSGLTSPVAAMPEGYVGSAVCRICHYDTHVNWKETLHAAIYRPVKAEYVLPDFTGKAVISDTASGIPPTTFTLTGGRIGPFIVSFAGKSFVVSRIHGGKPIAANQDPRDPNLAGHTQWIGKQRYQVKIGDSYYILPLQWNPYPDMDGKKAGWVNYNISNWVNASGQYILNLKTKSESTNCSGCHQTGVDLSYSYRSGQFSVNVADEVIACEACHGPGQDHAYNKGDITKIVNPAKLPLARANDVCNACHNRVLSKGEIDGVEMEFPFANGRTFRPGDTLSDFITDDGGYWPDGTSKKHHQQAQDYAQTTHSQIMRCTDCHNPHKNENEHMLRKTARNDSLCLDCHTTQLPNEIAVMYHSGHPLTDPASPRCVDCHMPGTMSSGAGNDIHSHTFKVLKPDKTLNQKMPNSCAINCHRQNKYGEGVADTNIGKWDEASDIAIAQWLLNRMGTIGRFMPTDTEYVGSKTCSQCHYEKYTSWQGTLHAHIYQAVDPANVLPNFSGQVVISDAASGIPPTTFTLSGGTTGPFQVTFLGQTYNVVRLHGGKAVAKNIDPREPTKPGGAQYLGKQRYHVQIGDSIYILPLQWNPTANLDGLKQGWVNYNIKNWVNSSGQFALNLKTKSEQTNCSGCHQTGVRLDYSTTTSQFSLKAADPVVACEACHGPGLMHAALADPARITNPEDLSTDRAIEVCTQCHIRGRGVGTLQGVEMEFPFANGQMYKPGQVLSDFFVEAGGFWPDGTSKQHHQQMEDYLKSEHPGEDVTCFTCHDPHGSSNEHDLVQTARNNTLCLNCHSSAFPNTQTIDNHTKHPSANPNSPRCTDCHMATFGSSGVEYDIHAHTFEVVSPQKTLNLNMPNSCAIRCHRQNQYGEGAVDTNVSKWNDPSDLTISNWLLNPPQSMQSAFQRIGAIWSAVKKSWSQYE